MRLSTLYDCGCDSCRKKINLTANNKHDDKFKSVLNAAENAFKHLHEKGSYKPEDINDKPYKDLTDQTYKVFDSAITDNDIPPEMLSKLQNDAFIFSGLKTHAQLLEASSLLLDSDGKIKGYDAFANDFNKINKNYNQNYLEAEYEFSVSSSQSAANWAATDPDGRYNLQYRTANDDRVREQHRVLQDITLPKDDPFWLSYYPPNGWRCRCTAVEVLKSKYDLSDSKKANEAGEKATTQIGKDGKNKLEIFRFNPGAEQKVFPPKHPYNKIQGAEKAKRNLDYVPEELTKYLKSRNVEIDPRFLGLLKEKVSFEVTKSHDNYNDRLKRVQIREYGTEYNVKAIIYHEFGHALDYQHGDLFKMTAKTMGKYQKRADYDEYFRKLDKLAVDEPVNSVRDKYEKGRFRDVIMSLNLRYGYGHTKKYFTEKGEFNRNREFLAHAFENKFVGNNMMKKLAPELYADMQSMMDEILEKIEK